jgi:CBS domain-containing protein
MKAMTVGAFLKSFQNPYKAVTVPVDATLQEVLNKMLECREQRSVFVVDGEGRLIGVISVGTLARHLLHEGVSPTAGFTPSTDILRYLTAELAGDIMDRDMVYCTREEMLEAVSAKMLGKKLYKTIPVLDETMHLVDVVSVISILEYALEWDGETTV